MRIIPGVVLLLSFICPGIASGQAFQVQGAAGPNIVDTAHNLSYGFEPGFSFSAGIGVRASPRVTFLLEVERTHRARQLRTDERGHVFGSRGGTTTLGVAQLRAALFGPDRVGPYAVVGLAAGVSEPNVTDAFPERVRNDVRAIVFGGGIRAPLGEQVSLFADVRFMFGGEGRNGVFGLSPIRAGLAWHF